MSIQRNIKIARMADELAQDCRDTDVPLPPPEAAPRFREYAYHNRKKAREESFSSDE